MCVRRNSIKKPREISYDKTSDDEGCVSESFNQVSILYLEKTFARIKLIKDVWTTADTYLK